MEMAPNAFPEPGMAWRCLYPSLGGGRVIPACLGGLSRPELCQGSNIPGALTIARKSRLRWRRRSWAAGLATHGTKQLKVAHGGHSEE